MSSPGALCGLWIDDSGRAHLAVDTGAPTGPRAERIADFRPFAWLREAPASEAMGDLEITPLAGDAPFRLLAHAPDLEIYQALLKLAREDESVSGGVDAVRPLENQFLLQTRQRLFAELPFAQLRRCQLDIEVASAEGGFPDATRPDDRIIAIGLRLGDCTTLLELTDTTDAAERVLLEQLNTFLATADPDTIEGHNVFKFDLEYLRQRAKRLKVPCSWGRFGQRAAWRSGRLKVAERWIDFPRCDLPGRAVIDTYLLVQQYDVSTRELTAFGLKDVALYFGITAEEEGARTYLAGDEIQHVFHSDRARFRAYLTDDLRETRGVADLLLPTYFEQARVFPILLQDATLRGTTSKIDLLFLEEYYHARHACPVPPEVQPFEGGYTRSFQEGVFRHVLHFDVASLYPSLLLSIGRNPRTDALGIFIPLLTRLREYRLRYKQLARTGATPEERAEAQARQQAFKILINSFYGYLGFSGARFGDGELAAEVTRRGRELLQALIDEFAKEGCTLLEADTDGIYLSSHAWWDRPEELLARVERVLPPGIELEYDGRYEAMFCYKAKNYALYDGEKITLRGSALRSRGIEPFLKQLSDRFIQFILGATTESPLALLATLRRQLLARELPVTTVAKTEVLSQNPDAYERFITGGGKPRRASAEAALQLVPRPRMGDRVSYYITTKAKGKTADWARARPVTLYDAQAAPYADEYYLKKLDDWLDRYGVFLGVSPAELAVADMVAPAPAASAAASLPSSSASAPSTPPPAPGPPAADTPPPARREEANGQGLLL